MLISFVYALKRFAACCSIFKISIEQCLIGEELSVFAICDGKGYKIIGNAQDHKRIFDDANQLLVKRFGLKLANMI